MLRCDVLCCFRWTAHVLFRLRPAALVAAASHGCSAHLDCVQKGAISNSLLLPASLDGASRKTASACVSWHCVHAVRVLQTKYPVCSCITGICVCCIASLWRTVRGSQQLSLFSLAVLLLVHCCCCCCCLQASLIKAGAVSAAAMMAVIRKHCSSGAQRAPAVSRSILLPLANTLDDQGGFCTFVPWGTL